ncbi:unnamed protein product [Lactuca virosa]|uniref:GTD-binding domain-containing protein n=1 Tax=Lactuca virosa TaxID=75947 RepID=A0AAU9LTS0_9ASTR|nr:unnamed protein product [Lactuca virosa]
MAASNGFMHNLSMAACEWFLMFLMFIDAALGFILTKFAHHCELQTPCLFCMRLDHVFSNENPGSYLSLFCYHHRAEISCLISCDLHEKLVDVRELCDDCFMSIMNRNQCSHGSSKGKMGIKGFQKPFLNRNLVRGPSNSGTCSCCKRHWNGKPSSRRLIQPGPAPLGGGPTVTMKPPLPRIAGHSRYRRRNVFKRDGDRISGASTPCHVEDSLSVDTDLDLDALSDFGCADYRLNSDSDSEFSFYEEDDTLKPEVLGRKADSGDDSSVRKGDSRDDSSVRKGDSRDECIVRKGDSGDESSVRKGDSVVRTKPSSLKSDVSIEEIKSRSISITSRGQDVNVNTTHVDDVKENGSIHDKSLKSDKILDHESDGYESPDASNVSEYKGEGVVEKLKRQVEGDQQRLHLLHKELEEERNAAAIAADEAMAMITRLQEEKSSLHMEALQYLRMMDEQAEYDMEALDKANDLIADKDKEIQDLEAELEYFRSRYEDELMGNNTMVETQTQNHIKNGNSKSPALGLEDEKKYILQSLSELEKKFMSNGNVERVKKEDENGRHMSNGFDVSTLESEILELNERLKALEADKSFIEHAFNTLTLQSFNLIIQHRRCQSVASRCQSFNKIKTHACSKGLNYQESTQKRAVENGELPSRKSWNQVRKAFTLFSVPFSFIQFCIVYLDRINHIKLVTQLAETLNTMTAETPSSSSMTIDDNSSPSVVQKFSLKKSPSSLTLVQFPHSLRLSSTNYMSWKTQIEVLLHGLDLYRFIDDTNPPLKPSITDGVSTPHVDHQTWFCQDTLLFGALVGTLSPSIVPLITNASSSLEAWNILSNTYAIHPMAISNNYNIG